MMTVIKTLCTPNDVIGSQTYYDVVTGMLSNYESYKENNGLYIFTELEIKFLNYFKDCYDKLGEIPTLEFFCDDNGVEYEVMEKINPIQDYRGLKLYVKSVLQKKLKNAVENEISGMAVTGAIENAEDKERINKLMHLGDKKERVYSTRFDFESDYKDRLSRPVGMKWPSRVLNEKAGEIPEGEITTICAYTSSFKSTLAMNIAHNNVFEGGYNIVVFSLETSKEMYWNTLISRHSIGLDRADGIPASKVRRLTLSDEEFELFSKANQHWEDNRAGNLIVVDEMDFETKDPREFTEILEEIDDLLQGNLHGFIVDYIQLLKNTSYSSGKSDAKAVGDYMEVFRNLTQGFRKGTKYEKKLAGIILSQVKRDAADYADSNNGVYYGPGIMSDSSELEKSSHTVVSSYTNAELKANKQALVQVLKARHGEVMSEPSSVTVTGGTYFFGDMEVISDGLQFDEMSGQDITDILSDTIDSGALDMGDIFSGGSSLY